MPDGAAPVLDVRGLKTVFRTRGGEVHAVNSVSFHLERGELEEVMPGFRAEPMPLSLLHPQRRRLSRRLQVFTDWLEALLRDEVLRG